MVKLFSRDALATAFERGKAQLAKSTAWKRLSAEQQADLATRLQLTPPPAPPLGTEDQILAALRNRALAEFHNLVDAVPQRFARPLEEAARLLEPKAVHLTLPSATIRNEAELETWLDEAREQIAEKLKDGPVIL